MNFTDSIIRDVLIAGIADSDIRREVLGTSAIFERAVNDVISLVEGKEMARNALPSSASGISSFKRDRPVSAAQPPLIDPRLRYAQIANKHLHSSRRDLAVGTPDHTVNASSATEDAVSDEAAHRLVSMLTHPNLRDGCRVRASVIGKRLTCGQPAVTPASPTPQTSSP